MSDSIRSESWWQSRIDEIKSQGFDTKNIVNELERNVSQASTIIEQYEKDLLLANTLFLLKNSYLVLQSKPNFSFKIFCFFNKVNRILDFY